jgi:hypothetical protein
MAKTPFDIFIEKLLADAADFSPSLRDQRAQALAVEDAQVSASPSQGEALPWEEPEDAGVIE